MMKFRENEEAVSPVIGVILMVAITVILAAVIAAFVFGMTGNVGTTKTVAATTQFSGSHLVITYQGGPDHASVTSVTANVVAADALTTNLIGTDNETVSGIAIGHKWSADVSSAAGKNVLITVTALFSDGTEQVILDKTQNIPPTPAGD